MLVCVILNRKTMSSLRICHALLPDATFGWCNNNVTLCWTHLNWIIINIFVVIIIVTVSLTQFGRSAIIATAAVGIVVVIAVGGLLCIF